MDAKPIRAHGILRRARVARPLCILICLWLPGGCPKSSPEARETPNQAGRNTTSSPWLKELADPALASFVHETGATGRFHFPEIMGGGVALLDANGDDRLDIYLTNGHTALPRLKSEKGESNRLFMQQEDGTFTDSTDVSGLGDNGYGMGVAVGDIDNNGLIDVYVTNYGPDALFANRGNARFENVTARALDDRKPIGPGWGTSATFLDFDRDGFLDLFVTRYVEVNALKECTDDLGRPDYCSPDAFYPVHDLLYRNRGDGTFTNVSQHAGIERVSAAGLGVACNDFNEDGWIDIYVANDGDANHLWINQQNGTFKESAFMLGAALNMNGKAEAGMGVIAADFDGDLDPDLFMTHLRQESNTFYENLGSTRGFADRTGHRGLAVPSLPFTGFGTAACDFDGDGDLDIAVTNGAVVRKTGTTPTSKSFWENYAETNLLFIQEGSRFYADAMVAGPFSSGAESSRGMAAGDLDGDGDKDLVVANLAATPRIFLNDAAPAGRRLVIRAYDPRLKRDAIGADVTIGIADDDRPGSRAVRKTIGGGNSYLSAGSLRAHFAIPRNSTIQHVIIDWPDGAREKYSVKPDAAGALELLRTEGDVAP